MCELLFNDFIRGIFFFILFCSLICFANWAFPNILSAIRQRDRFLAGKSNLRGVVLLVVASVSIGVMLYVLWDCCRYGDFITLEEKWPLFAAGVGGVLLFLYLFKDFFNVEQIKAQFPQINEALEKIAQEARVLQGKIEAFTPRLESCGRYLKESREDYRWERIESEKETFDVCQAFYRCWNKYKPDESSDRQSSEYRRVVEAERADAGRLGEEMKKKIVETLDEYRSLFSQSFGQSSPLQNLPDANDLQRLADSNALELTSVIDRIAIRLKSDKNKTILNAATNDGMPWKVYDACLNGLERYSNVARDYDDRLDDFIKPNGFIKKLEGLLKDVQTQARQLCERAKKIDDLIQTNRDEVQKAPSHWSGNFLYTLLKKHTSYLNRQENDLRQAKLDFEVLKKRVEANLADAFKLATELVFARIRLVGKRAERWALGFEEVLELSKGLRDENLLDYERIFDAERRYEIQNKALASSNPILKKYATIIDHFEPDRFFNIELPFPMLSSERQNLEDPVVGLTKSLTDGIENWKTATFKLMKEISKKNPDLIVARCTSHLLYQPGESEVIVVVKPVVDRGNVKLSNNGEKFEYRMERNPDSDDSDLELNVSRSTSVCNEGLLELAYVALRLTITQDKLEKIAGFSGLFADPRTISRKSQSYKPNDYKAGSQNGRYVCIGMTHGTSQGHSSGYSFGLSQGNSRSHGANGGGYSENWGTNVSWTETESTGTSENELWIPDVNSDPNFSKLTKNELAVLSKTIEDIMGQLLRDDDLGINQDDAPNAEKADSKEIRNRKRFK